MKGRNWSRDELVLALNLYLKLPFGQMHSRTPEIISLASLIDRSPGAVAMRLSNFANVNPYHQQRGVSGLPGGRKQVQPIWDEFIRRKEEFLFISEGLLATLEGTTIDRKFKATLRGTEKLQGIEKIRETKIRVNQHVFREIVLSNYSSRYQATKSFYQRGIIRD